MKRMLIAGLAAVPTLLLLGCQNPTADDTTQVEETIPGAQQVTLKMTGMT